MKVKNKSSFLQEFKTFVMRGNVLDMAVGVIIGGAFGKISTSLVNDILMPFISFLFGSRDMNGFNVVLRPETVNEAGETVAAITIGFGSFIGTVIDFLLIAFVIFLLVRFMNKAHAVLEKKKKAEEEEKKAEEPKKPGTDELLEMILEELKNK